MYARSLLAAASVALTPLALPASASDLPPAPEGVEEKATASDDEAQEIVVLGTRRDRADRTLSSDVVTERMSQSSRSIERDLLTASGSYRLSDALELVSGVSNQNNRGGFLDNFAIRGFLGTPDGGAEYYVDGFLANRGLGPPRDPATAERVELLKGPAGALFGDIDPGGRVNIVTKTPRFDASASAVLTFGSFGNRRIELDATGPLSSTFAARLVVAAEDSDGWRDYVTLRRRVLAPSLSWTPSADLRLTYVGEFTEFDAPFDRGIPAIAGNANALPASRFYGEPGDGTTRFRNQRHQLTGLTSVGGGLTLNGGIAYRTGSLRGFSSDQSRLVDGHTLWRQRRQRDFGVDDLSARVELAGQFGGHRASIGLKGYMLDYREGWMRRNPSAANPYAIDVYDPVYGGVSAPLLPFTNNREKRWAATLYLQDMWDLTERLTLTGGVRLDTYRQRIRNNRTGAVARTIDEPLNFRIGARYRIDDRFALHANWGESFLLNSGTGRDGLGFGPERGKGYELGATAAWPGIDIAITWFDIAKHDILTNDPVDPNFLAPVGSLTSRGIEFDAAIKLDDRWQIVANYAWTRARADDPGFASDVVLNVPEHAGTLFAVGRFHDAGGRGVSISAGGSYIGDRAGAIDGSGLILPAYFKAKAALEYAFSPRLGIRIEAENLFDARYAQSSYSPVWVFPGAPRKIRASLRSAF
ncbi:TonB-dependent siderophore receptor [Sphingomonas sp. G-3-2-10]|uniref:TonB-dependent siderophore receptor n=1 Tax=Sphingomonas sp. G-3-2-10 TaxID=2728838 RepID=UPI00146F37DC|nr:TonB-dependent siderophore receptor [Sphingomonas sp. G-3-2-10]NML05618.1 TonB-dependent siderophore receptor [Sphingomonas sp. G-3-2-10]